MVWGDVSPHPGVLSTCPGDIQRTLAGLSAGDHRRRYSPLHAAERGEESLEHLVRLYAGHDLLHLRQIERIRAAVASDAP